MPVGQAAAGYWRVGNEVTGGVSAGAAFRGVLDEVAVYDRVLSPATIAAHVALGGVEPVNAAPIAQFTSTTNFLAVGFDGSGSSDPDGTVQGWSWNFGDGSTGSGATISHTYAAAGTYSVSLTVTDDHGKTTTLTKSVQAAEPPAGTTIAADQFGRVVSNGWGSADVGGAWTTSGTASQYAVSGAKGTQRMAAPGAGPAAYLGAVTAVDASMSVDIAWDKAPTGNGVYASLDARRIGTSEYRARVRAMPTSTSLTLFRLVNGVETSLGVTTIPGLTYNVGDVIRLRFEVVGTSPTSLSAKAWKVGQPEPAGWQVVASDSTATLQATGGVGLVSYLSASTTNSPVTASFSSFSTVTPGIVPPPVDQPPVAAFTYVVSGLSVTTDASSSTDDHGVASYVWDFGGTARTGVNPTYAFPSAGTYPVTLTVTDTNGATNALTQQVTVVDVPPPPPPPVALAADDFERVVVNGFGTADNGGAWTSTGSASSFGVSGGAGRITIGAAGVTRGATLAGVAVGDVDARVDLSLDKAPSAGGGYYSLSVRRTANNDYGVRVRLQAGATTLQLVRTINGAVTTVASTSIAGYIYQPGDVIHLRISATGSGTTALGAAMWVNGDTPPAGWLVQGSDSTAAMQGPGGIGVLAYVAASATEAPVVVSVDKLVAVPA